MKNPILIVAVALIVVCSIAAYFYWQQDNLKPEPVHLQSPLPPPPLPHTLPPMPEVRQPVEAPPSLPPLPALSDSDQFMLTALAELVGNKSLMKYFHGEKIIHNIVATIDNLPTRRAPMRVMPVTPVPGNFIVSGSSDEPVIGARNAARYSPYVRIAESIDAKKLVEVYVRLYPLFQEAYEKLGYPKKYFNDRLIEVIDNLLMAPVIREPVKLVQPNVLYLFADTDLEERSIGQKTLMRMGGGSEGKIKTKLREIKRELLRHMHGGKVISSS